MAAPPPPQLPLPGFPEQAPKPKLVPDANIPPEQLSFDGEGAQLQSQEYQWTLTPETIETGLKGVKEAREELNNPTEPLQPVKRDPLSESQIETGKAGVTASQAILTSQLPDVRIP